ncbi:hypothetical protein Hanom_Chr12g01154451 [Helianthus anomalus]
MQSATSDLRYFIIYMSLKTLFTSKQKTKNKNKHFIIYTYFKYKSTYSSKQIKLTNKVQNDP